MDYYSVKSMTTNKVVESGFDKKADAKAKRNELCKDTWDKWNKSKKAEEKGEKPFPFTVTKGKDHPRLND